MRSQSFKTRDYIFDIMVCDLDARVKLVMVSGYSENERARRVRHVSEQQVRIVNTIVRRLCLEHKIERE